jgi:hypothetical protein
MPRTRTQSGRTRIENAEAGASEDLRRQVLHQLACQRALHDPAIEPRNRNPRLPELRRWQMQRLARSFQRFLDDPVSRPAAEFFLSDLYGDRDFSGRDRDVARILPMMTRILPAQMIATAGDALALSSLSHAFDLRMAEVLSRSLAAAQPIDDAHYADAYRNVARPHLRREQIALIGRIGHSLDAAVQTPTLWHLLKLSRIPAKIAGLSALQSFLERGFGAFRVLGGAGDFVQRIVAQETEVSRRLFARDPRPFAATVEGPAAATAGNRGKPGRKPGPAQPKSRSR